MREVTAEELATWLGELPEEARPNICIERRPDAHLNTASEWYRDGEQLMDDEVLALWFTAATLWMWEREYWVKPPTDGGNAGWLLRHNRVSKCDLLDSGPYAALAAAVRRVRAEEGKR